MTSYKGDFPSSHNEMPEFTLNSLPIFSYEVTLPYEHSRKQRRRSTIVHRKLCQNFKIRI